MKKLFHHIVYLRLLKFIINVKIINDIINFILFQVQKTKILIHKLTNLIRFTETRGEVK